MLRRATALLIGRCKGLLEEKEGCLIEKALLHASAAIKEANHSPIGGYLIMPAANGQITALWPVSNACFAVLIQCRKDVRHPGGAHPSTTFLTSPHSQRLRQHSKRFKLPSRRLTIMPWTGRNVAHVS